MIRIIKNKKVIVLFLILLVVGIGLWFYMEDIGSDKIPKKADFVYNGG